MATPSPASLTPATAGDAAFSHNFLEIPNSQPRRRKAEPADHDEEEELVFSAAGTLGKLGLTAGSTRAEQKRALRWAMLASYLPEDVKSIERSFVRHAEYSLAQVRTSLTQQGAYQALSLSVRDRLIERWKDTQLYFQEKGCKRVAYMSMEFLLGRSLQNAIVNLGLEDNYMQAMMNLGMSLEDLYDEEKDAGLGNGGLGRLAACFLDSLATQDYPGWGYGLRYTYGMFHQAVKNGYQVEFPDYWLIHGNPWEIERLDVTYPVNFYGRVHEWEEHGVTKYSWEDTEQIVAVAYDVPIPGYKTFNTLNIRLWSAKPGKEFDLEHFNRGDFFKAIEDKQRAEGITHVLYPNDHTPQGQELRLKQQYFFVCATLQDLVRRFRKYELPWSDFPEKVAIQLNDTHPTLAIPELLRILIDLMGLSWKEAWAICMRTFSYTNHTVLPEALEKWPVGLLEHLLPRHLKIIYTINHKFLKKVAKKWPNDAEKLASMSLIEEGDVKKVRMAFLATVGSHTINGVAALHSEILKDTIFKDFYAMFPNRFQNKTNGVTPRRWIYQSNPDLSLHFGAWLKTEDWLTNYEQVKKMMQFIDNEQLRDQWIQIKKSNKERLANFIKKNCGIAVNINALFDVQVKRFHEYKRQLLNILSVIYRYHILKTGTPDQKSKIYPRVVIFGGKAAPGYYIAKLIIKLINSVADVINNDKTIGNMLKIVFIPNYCVSLAEIIIPASDISQHISTAGTEASGTSNMKFAMNGGLIIGTLDGANVEIREEIGEANMFIFGAKTEEVPAARKLIRSKEYKPDKRFTLVLDLIKKGLFGDPSIFEPIINSLTGGNDFYILGPDFPSYLEVQERIDATYKDQAQWTKMSMTSAFNTAKFSSDRTIREYANDIWGIKPVRRPGPLPVSVESIAHSGIFGPGFVSSPLNTPTGFTTTISVEKMSPSEIKRQFY